MSQAGSLPAQADELAEGDVESMEGGKAVEEIQTEKQSAAANPTPQHPEEEEHKSVEETERPAQNARLHRETLRSRKTKATSGTTTKKYV